MENESKEKTATYKLPTLAFSFYLASDKEYFIDNLSMLLDAGIGVGGALLAIKKGARSAQMKSVIEQMSHDVEDGVPLWQVVKKSKLFSAQATSLIRVGEEAGKLVDNLKVIAVEQQKERLFHGKIRSAMMYPVFVLALAFVFAAGITWFILPRLSYVFTSLRVKLPLATRVLISSGDFLGRYGFIVVPAFLFLVLLLIYLFFFFPRTKFIGEEIIFAIPVFRRLIQEVEISRFGYILGTMLAAGLPLVDSLEALRVSSESHYYQQLFTYLKNSIDEGNSFKKSFDAFAGTDKLIPPPIRQMIVTGEQSGRLADTLIKIGEIFESKVDNTTKNLATIIEPVLLVIVWLGVLLVALAIIMPIYSLIGSINSLK